MTQHHTGRLSHNFLKGQGSVDTASGIGIACARTSSRTMTNRHLWYRCPSPTLRTRTSRRLWYPCLTADKGEGEALASLTKRFASIRHEDQTGLPVNQLLPIALVLDDTIDLFHAQMHTDFFGRSASPTQEHNRLIIGRRAGWARVAASASG